MGLFVHTAVNGPIRIEQKQQFYGKSQSTRAGTESKYYLEQTAFYLIRLFKFLFVYIFYS